MFLILVTSRPNFNLSFTQPESIKVFLFFLNLAFFTSVAFLEIQNTKILQRLVSWNSQIKQRKMSTQSSLTTTENGHKIHFSFFPELSVIIMSRSRPQLMLQSPPVFDHLLSNGWSFIVHVTTTTAVPMPFFLPNTDSVFFQPCVEVILCYG